ncbi:uncharacterized protein DUF4157 [Humibacillus xanthopallidus]|uniref:Uncharacterized protein DUF4157 n=1 Tax=Humibacillus xanthopallidus TaxID=412689 RepID=A0A543PQ93_9MICO|nr:DUF4157 domain-containing protein [Humibacillus xanthopallidus]TQN46253.1 uncharacterized protein DUF4157 [Humibacillus xanthopallidus]
MTPAHARTPAQTPEAAAPASGVTRLPEATEQRASRFLDHDFAHVRVHADSEAERLTDGLDARAATIGRDIYFAPGEFRPGTVDGERLIGHELAHVIQQEGGQPTSGATLDPQAAAELAGVAVAQGRPSRVGQPATPSGRPALEPKPPAPTVDAGTVAKTTPTTNPVVAPVKSWDDRVTAAQAETDLTVKSAALTALAQEALGTAYTVKEAGTTVADKLDPADYALAPTINFDVRLTSKKKTNGNPVGDVSGHTFGPGPSAQYCILGPKALKAGSPMDVALYADHELYHSRKPSAGELEVWTDSFVHYFIKTFGNQWSPLIGYYDAEKPDTAGKFPQREATITALDTYYRGLSDTVPAGEKNSDKRKFILWFRRRISDRPGSAFITDLSAKTGVTATEPADTPAAPKKP